MAFRPDRLKYLRNRKNINQQELADMLGMTQPQIARWENGSTEPQVEAVVRIAKALSCTTDWLLGLSDDAQSHAKLRELNFDEQRLIELYRQQKLPEIISRLVNELAARANTQADLVVDSPDKPDIPTQDKSPDR